VTGDLTLSRIHQKNSQRWRYTITPSEGEKEKHMQENQSVQCLALYDNYEASFLPSLLPEITASGSAAPNSCNAIWRRPSPWARHNIKQEIYSLCCSSASMFSICFSNLGFVNLSVFLQLWLCFALFFNVIITSLFSTYLFIYLLILVQRFYLGP
jgi:hypothetical protein